MDSPSRLLISVQNSVEAKVALTAGADLIDVKDPQRGSLGRADVSAIEQVLQEVRLYGKQVPVSAAWGELQQLSVLENATVPTGLVYLKMGLSGMRKVCDWEEQWLRARQKLCQNSNLVEAPPGWIAVAYVNDQLADAPPVESIVDAAIRNRCAGVLFDTYSKSSGPLLKWLDEGQLRAYFHRLSTEGLLGVAAGQLRKEDLPTMNECGADVIAVRSAVCRNKDRTQKIDSTAVRELRTAMRASSRPAVVGSSVAETAK